MALTDIVKSRKAPAGVEALEAAERGLAELAKRHETELAAAVRVRDKARAELCKELRRALADAAKTWRTHAQDLRDRAGRAGDATQTVPVTTWFNDGRVQTVPELRFTRDLLGADAARADEVADRLEAAAAVPVAGPVDARGGRMMVPSVEVDPEAVAAGELERLRAAVEGLESPPDLDELPV